MSPGEQGLEQKQQRKDLKRESNLGPHTTLTQSGFNAMATPSGINEHIEEMRRLRSAAARISQNTSQSREPHTPSAASTPAAGDQETTADYEELSERIAVRIANSLAMALNQHLEDGSYRSSRPLFKFSGRPQEDPDKFLFKATAYFASKHIQDDEEKLAIIGDQLKGDAKRWYERFEDVIITFDEFKDKFRNRYGSVSALAEGRRMLYGTEQGKEEDTELFITRKWNLMQRFDPALPTSAKLEIIADQLRPDVSCAVQGRSYEDVELFAQAALKAEKNIQRKRDSETTQAPTRTTTAAKQTNPFRTTERIQPRASVPQPSTLHDTRASSSRDINRPPTPCRFCGQWHYHSDCPQNPYRRTGNGQAGGSGPLPSTQRASSENPPARD